MNKLLWPNVSILNAIQFVCKVWRRNTRVDNNLLQAVGIFFKFSFLYLQHICYFPFQQHFTHFLTLLKTFFLCLNYFFSINFSTILLSFLLKFKTFIFVIFPLHIFFAVFQVGLFYFCFYANYFLIIDLFHFNVFYYIFS